MGDSSARQAAAGPRRLDVAVALLLALAAGVASYHGAQRVDPALLEISAGDVWFDADAPRVYANMTARGSDHYRTKVHPLFSLLTYTPVAGLRSGLGIGPATAVRLLVAAVAAAWLAVVFTLLRLIGCRRLDAVLFSALAACSASALFWFVVPEAYGFGSLSILLALTVVALAERRQLGMLTYTCASAMTLSFTITNWMAGIIATAVQHPWRRALQITVNAFCIVVALWVVQKAFFPSAQFFLGDTEEERYVLRPDSGGPLEVAQAFFLHSLVMPSITPMPRAKATDWPMMRVQPSAPGSAGPYGQIGVVLWVILLNLGVWALFRSEGHGRFRLALALTLLGQLSLHVVYGRETFLYALHFGPLLVLVAALATLTWMRPLACVAAAVLLCAALVNNVQQFRIATAFLRTHGTPRHVVQREMEARPADPWPRGVGHVVLAPPGSRDIDKAYHEPGGSFSPAVNSFGVALWVTDPSGQLLATSDTVPLEDIHQRLRWSAGELTPSIRTATPAYRAVWSSAGVGRWQLRLRGPSHPEQRLSVVLRGVGPAGGPLQVLRWTAPELMINTRWSVRIDPPPARVFLGSETTPGWKTEWAQGQQWQDANGWGVARVEMSAGSEWTVVIEDHATIPPPELGVDSTRAALDLTLPDESFTACLDAQAAHLLMGLVGRQTRPGDPTHYPAPWERDAAYIVTALAHAGHLGVAKTLSSDLAEEDFFGGFGPEADAPGTALWALEEVQARLVDPERDRQLWPHVRRKAELILEMMSTEQPMRRPLSGPILPALRGTPELSLLAEPARDGLIVGKMDQARPLLYVNALSYRGLLAAAALAVRTDHADDAQRWRAAAARLRTAWQLILHPPASNDPRTYASGMWPTWVAAAEPDRFLARLRQHWRDTRVADGSFRDTPQWTYFDIAEAHQWLLLGHADRAWRTLRWFWAHQASPGLYTWWEGHDEENTSYRWERVRGWLHPPHVTPHYWTAAEMLLLQLDMLAYVDESGETPTVVVGSGVRSDWLTHAMHVGGLPIPGGQLDWTWDGTTMQVTFRGPAMPVRLGAVFPPETPIWIASAPAR